MKGVTADQNAGLITVLNVTLIAPVSSLPVYVSQKTLVVTAGLRMETKPLALIKPLAIGIQTPMVQDLTMAGVMTLSWLKCSRACKAESQ